MKKHLRYKILVFAWSILLFGCANNSPKGIKSAEWLIGTWENKTQRGSIYETWTKANKNELSGISYALPEKDTVVFETIKLVWTDDSLFYIPSVRNQNNNQPVRFVLKAVSKSQMVFEKPDHDFPQLISYTQMTPDSLVAEISGIQNGEERKLYFRMKKVK